MKWRKKLSYQFDNTSTLNNEIYATNEVRRREVGNLNENKRTRQLTRKMIKIENGLLENTKEINEYDETYAYERENKKK